MRSGGGEWNAASDGCSRVPTNPPRVAAEMPERGEDLAKVTQPDLGLLTTAQLPRRGLLAHSSPSSPARALGITMSLHHSANLTPCPLGIMLPGLCQV